MHFHLEIIMPPTDDVSAAIDTILAPFSENQEPDADGYTSPHTFWDWYVIGGRMAGTKETCTYPAEKLEEFYKQLKKNKITISSVICGKQEIEPADQIPLVDKLWSAAFPTEDGTIIACPLFSHSNNQYSSDDLISCDICRVDEIPAALKCSRVIIAAPNYEDKLAADYMICEDQWNGVVHMPIDWDRKPQSAVDNHQERVARCAAEYKEKHTIKPNWICVTVDYHS